MSDSEDDSPQLSAHTLAALQEFCKEQKEQQDKILTAQETGDVKNIALGEDWNLSQFWYSDETALRLAEEALSIAGENGRIACVSAPTAYKKIKELNLSNCTVKCLEYDERFKVFGEDFQFYDYKDPLNLPLDMKQAFDIVIADPPFLSEECLCKTAVTVKYLAKEKVILCTGAIMEDLAYKLLGVKPCKFEPKHTSQLQNEFKCYTNYHSDLLNRS